MYEQWKVFKDKENEYKELRLRLEADILAAHPNAKEVGKIRITYKNKEDWDQVTLIGIKDDFPFWPFKTEYKPVASDMKALQEHYPEHYKKLQDHLTITPAKPSFVWKE